jgi:hypothetical protein
MSEIHTLSRKKSVMYIEKNPLESGCNDELLNFKMENLTDAVPINPSEVQDLIKQLIIAE